MPGSSTSQSNQRTGQKLACEACRRRKLGCDGKKPKCSMCQAAGIDCEVSAKRGPRGPKKGYLSALQTKIAILENRLQVQESGQAQFDQQISDIRNISASDEMVSPCTTLPSIATADIDNFRPDINLINIPMSRGLITPSESFFSSIFDAEMMSKPVLGPSQMLISVPIEYSPSSNGLSARSSTVDIPVDNNNSVGLQINSMQQAELDQLYFDRMHDAIPILHQRRYLSWAKSSVKTKAHMCLQHAVWATASLTSPQFQHLGDTIYLELKRLLAAISLPSVSKGQALIVDVELVQAWVLAATFEFVKTYHHEACISAGRAFRLVQLMGLHEIDSFVGTRNDAANIQDPISTEEKRRIFWMAYILETLYSIQNNLPLMLNEKMISTALPMPDHEFQNGEIVITGFVDECMVQPSYTVQSPFNECIMLVAMCTRILFHTHQSHKHSNCLPNGSETRDQDWQQWLDSVLVRRLQTLAQDYPSVAHSSNPMLLFANFLAQASIVYICKEISLMKQPSQDQNHSQQAFLVADYQQKAFGAVQQIVQLARSLTSFPFFKIHPFIPIPLHLCIEFLSLNCANVMTLPLLHDLMNVLQHLTSIDKSQQAYVDLLCLAQMTAMSLHG